MVRPVWSPRRWPWFAGLAAATLVVTLAGCAGDEPPVRVATAGGQSAHPSASETTGVVAEYVAAQRQWVGCLREHGFQLPDPDSRGNVDLRAPGGPKKSDPKWTAAQMACAKYAVPVPAELEEKPEPLTEQEIQYQRAYARCMRESGATNFPDPDPSGYFPQGNNEGGPGMSEQESEAQLRASLICEPVQHGQPRKTAPGPLPSAKG
ncbi:hypothetical protein ACGFI9_20425 [Micromonospora sp. NPDC048930]|uniref:hypothetical protein n=1 Tax=Micromonospora sp. NPDC048930 TaxID=3364261 RepID=UPI00371EA1C0